MGMRGRGSRLYLSDITVTTGVEKPIDGLPELADGDLLAQLRADGLANVRIFTEPAWRVAATTARSTLERAGGPPDHVVFETDGRRDLDESPSELAAHFLVEAGLDKVPTIGTNLHRCAGMGAMLTVGHGLLASAQARQCLLVTVDSAPDDARLQDDGIGVFSDAAASAVLTAELGSLPAFRVLGVETATHARLGLVTAAQDSSAAAAEFFESIEGAARRLGERTALAMGDYTYAIVNNYVRSAALAMLDIVGVPAEKFVDGLAARYAHCHAADGLLALEHLRTERGIADGDTVLVLSTAPHIWCLTALEYLAA